MTIPIDPVSGKEIGPTVWEEPRYHHAHQCDPMTLVRCGCGRLEHACMMVDVRVLSPAERPSHGADFACSMDVSHAQQQGRHYPDDLAAKHGAPDHIVAIMKIRGDAIRERHAALAARMA